MKMVNGSTKMMKMNDDLVRKLREPWFTNGCERYQLDAADRIEALTAERDHAWEMVAKADTQVGQALADRLQDKAQIDCLMEALERIAKSEPRPKRSGDYDRADVSALQRIARFALKGETP